MPQKPLKFKNLKQYNHNSFTGSNKELKWKWKQSTTSENIPPSPPDTSKQVEAELEPRMAFSGITNHIYTEVLSPVKKRQKISPEKPYETVHWHWLLLLKNAL